LLQKNAPGRYSTWNEYNETSTSRGDDEIDDDNDTTYIDQALSATAPPATATSICTTTCQDYGQGQVQGQGQSSNTGVKGVLSDHRHAKALEKIELANDIQQRKEAFRKATEAAWMMPGEESISISAMRMKERQSRGCGETVVVSEQMKHMNLENSSEEDDDDSFDDDDDDFMKVYYQQRMTQMSASASVPPRATYGSVTELNDLIHFSNVIDETNPDTHCVFHIYEYDNYNEHGCTDSDRDGVPVRIPCCQLMNEHLDQLSHELQHTRFFRLRAHKVKENFDPVGFPCVLIYKNGKEVANLTPLTNHSHFDSCDTTTIQVSGDLTRGTNCRFTMEDVQHVLSLHGVKD